MGEKIEYSSDGGSDVLNPGEERAELKKQDGGFYGHMAVNKIKTGHRKAKAKHQRSF
jgi:hypothetical protein